MLEGRKRHAYNYGAHNIKYLYTRLHLLTHSSFDRECILLEDITVIKQENSEGDSS